jgi:molybdate transport system ATP-binding protein
MSLLLRARKNFGLFSVDVDLAIGPGVTALFGPSGSGKTTLIRILAGLARPDTGHMTLNGVTMMDTHTGQFTPPHRRHFGMVFQEARLFPHLTVRRNLAYGRWFSKKTDTRDDPARILSILGIDHLLDRKPENLSGGEKQRVAIGRALLSAPDLLLMDEPLAALDDERKAEILPYLELLRDETRIPIVYVSHSVAEVARLATTVIVMNNGSISAQGPVSDIFSQPGFAHHLERSGQGSLIEARATFYDPVYGLNHLQSGNITIQVPGSALPQGKTVRMHILARDIMIATRKPEDLSALNILPGTIVSMDEPVDQMVSLRIDCAGTGIMARITRLSADRLGLAKGRAVYAIIKSVALEPVFRA